MDLMKKVQYNIDVILLKSQGFYYEILIKIICQNSRNPNFKNSPVPDKTFYQQKCVH